MAHFTLVYIPELAQTQNLSVADFAGVFVEYNRASFEWYLSIF